MANSFTKVFLLLLVAVAAVAHNPHIAGGLRAKSHPLHKSNDNNNNNNKKHPIPNRNLENHKKFNKNIGNNHKRPTKHKPKPPSRHLQRTFAPSPIEPGTIEPGTFYPISLPFPEPELCGEATDLRVGETFEGSLAVPEGTWFSVVGTGGILAASTCTGNPTLDGSALDTAIDVFSGGCDVLNYEASDDDGGSCGNFKSTVYFQTVAGETYNVYVYPYFWSSEPVGLPFGLTVYEVTELPNNICLGATPVELDGTVEGEISEIYGMAWYSFVGTGNDLVVSTCTGNGQLDNTPFDSVIQVLARDCDDLRYIDDDDEGGKCGNGKSAVILPSVQGLTYHVAVFEYMGMPGPFGLKISTKST